MQMKSSPPMWPTIGIAIVEFFEVIEIGVARGERRIRRDAARNLGVDLDRTRQPRRRMHVEVAIGPSQHRAEANRRRGIVDRVGQHLVSTAPERRVEGCRVRADERRGRDDAGERVRLEARERAEYLGSVSPGVEDDHAGAAPQRDRHERICLANVELRHAETREPALHCAGHRRVFRREHDRGRGGHSLRNSA